jgi:hypothetical protein
MNSLTSFLKSVAVVLGTVAVLAGTPAKAHAQFSWWSSYWTPASYGYTTYYPATYAVAPVSCCYAPSCNTCAPACSTCAPNCATCAPACNACTATCNSCVASCNTCAPACSTCATCVGRSTLAPTVAERANSTMRGEVVLPRVARNESEKRLLSSAPNNTSPKAVNVGIGTRSRTSATATTTAVKREGNQPQNSDPLQQRPNQSRVVSKSNDTNAQPAKLVAKPIEGPTSISNKATSKAVVDRKRLALQGDLDTQTLALSSLRPVAESSAIQPESQTVRR